MNNQDFIATGEIVSEDDSFIIIQDRFEGMIRIGKKFIMKIRKEGTNENVSNR
jgi:hypothetical protein